MDQVEVVQDQGDDLGQLGQSGPDQQRFPGAESRGGRHLPKCAVTGQGANDPQCAQHVGPECPQFVVGFVDRQPRHRRGVGQIVCPGRHREGLPVPGAGADQGDRTTRGSGQPFLQAAASHETGWQGRW